MSEIDDTIAANIATSLAEIPHPSLPKGSNIYGGTKLFPDCFAAIIRTIS